MPLNIGMDYGHWDISAVGDFDDTQFFGFIYEIEEIVTGRCYIGKKNFRFKRQKTKSNPSRYKDSDWRDYTSSCEPLCEAIEEQGKAAFVFRILSLCSGKCQLTYEEQQVQFTRDVLRAKLPNGERKYWNRTIGHFLFAGVEKQTEETKAKIAARLQGNTNAVGAVRTPESRKLYSAAKKGVPKSSEHREHLRQVGLGKIQSSETCAKRAITMSTLRWWTDGSRECRSLECPGVDWHAGRVNHIQP